MATALREHDALLRQTIESKAGFVFKTVGDEYCAAFSTVSDAAQAAIDGQRALKARDWSQVGGLRVRMALHTGTADQRDDDYFGPAVNRVARLLSSAHGGQILVSGTSASLLKAQLPADMELRDLGSYKLKDLALPERIYQLCVPDLETSFSPLRTGESKPNNLPHQVSSLVGRADVISDIKDLLLTAGLVTISGPGGIGKTRTALAVGEGLLDRYEDGVWFVELSALRDPDSVPRAIASALDIRETPGRPLIDVVLSALSTKHALLIVDNCEHVIDSVAKVLLGIMRVCPKVQFVATSRESLRIKGEHVYRLPTLPSPTKSGHTTASEASKYPSVALFVDRAVAADAKFELTDENAATVASICRRLDGLALAIELAAARVAILTPDEIASRLDERLQLLSADSRDAQPRQRTLRALIDWSYDLLSSEERILLRRIAVFVGGLTLESARAVCSDDSIEENSVLPLLTALIDKSLVASSAGASAESRFKLLESTREYAIERLRESGEAARLTKRHAEFIRHFAQRAETKWPEIPETEWLAHVTAEIENIWAALEWSLKEANDPSLGAQIATSLRFLWVARLYHEGADWLNLALKQSGELDPALAARVLLEVGLVQWQSDRTVDLARKSVETYRAADDATGLCGALRVLGEGLINRGRFDEATDVLNEALGIETSSLGGPSANTLAYLGYARIEMGDTAAARSLLREAQSAEGGERSTRDHAIIVRGLAEVELIDGNVARATDLASEAVQLLRALADPRLSSWATVLLAHCYANARQIDQAAEAAREALALASESIFPLMVTESMIVTAWILEMRGEAERAARILGYVRAFAPSLPIRVASLSQRRCDELGMDLAVRIGDREFRRLCELGSRMKPEEALATSSLMRASQGSE